MKRNPTERWEELAEMGSSLASKLTPSSVLSSISRPLHSVVPFDRAALMVYDAQSDSRRILAMEGRMPPSAYGVGTRIKRTHASHGWTAFDEQRETVRSSISDLNALGPGERRLYGEGLRSLLSVPLILEGKSIGTLNLGSQTDGQYSAVDLAFVRNVAHQVALAMGNIIVREEIATLRPQPDFETQALPKGIHFISYIEQSNLGQIIGASGSLQKTLQIAARVAQTDSTVLITGETGTGKDLIARAIHALSQRSGRPLVKVNCAALPASLFESELFGHEKGSFTGALQKRLGRFELADHGTIFLDEIAEISLEAQAKLLGVLQHREFERVGGNKTIRVNARVIAATNRNLVQGVSDGSFRRDLYYRLKVVPIEVPPLRDRREDIPLLIQHFVRQVSLRTGRHIERVSQSTVERLCRYDWPGNVRELESVIERAVVLSFGPTLEIPGEVLLADSMQDLTGSGLTMEAVERDHISRVLKRSRGVIEGAQGAARVLGLHPNTLRSRMKKLGIGRASHENS